MDVAGRLWIGLAGVAVHVAALRFGEVVQVAVAAGRVFVLDRAERRAILDDALGRVDRQVATLQTKMDRLAAMIAEAHARRAHLEDHIRELDSGIEPAPHTHDGPRR